MSSYIFGCLAKLVALITTMVTHKTTIKLVTLHSTFIDLSS